GVEHFGRGLGFSADVVHGGNPPAADMAQPGGREKPGASSEAGDTVAGPTAMCGSCTNLARIFGRMHARLRGMRHATLALMLILPSACANEGTPFNGQVPGQLTGGSSGSPSTTAGTVAT